MKIYAVVRAFEIIGEASKIISPDIKLAHPLIERQMMTDFRNILSHHYLVLNMKFYGKP
jgi:uncharacterized protein with HEPN domain